MVYDMIYESAWRGGTMVGGLFWQLMDSYRDGYEVVFGEAPSTTGVITTQSWRLHSLDKEFARAKRGKQVQMIARGINGGN
ncbi:hypothetical protein GUJ93_ZPchr0009g237 [Zizania palustris]|uniref:Beta-mannosidase n=1 Tax=Zizania palustris TaxID=103762 RepID=A0A8J5VKX5_ZIZPA|nr:hypothetical protein GUJ93_ZPchr0009g237 [Zizania palustris]